MPAHDALALVQASPAAVARRDRAGWLELFAADATIEDPVGAATYRGRERLSAFWDAFIAPQVSITFVPHREFVSDTLVARQVTIETVTVADAPALAVEALLEYRVQGDRIGSLRAFWDPAVAVGWYARRGVGGIAGLLRHGARMTTGLGLGSALAFGRALAPDLRGAETKAQAGSLLTSSRSEWIAALRDADVWVAARGNDRFARTPEAAWSHAREDGAELRLQALHVTGEHAAMVVGDGVRSAAAFVRVAGRKLAALTWLWS